MLYVIVSLWPPCYKTALVSRYLSNFVFDSMSPPRLGCVLPHEQSVELVYVLWVVWGCEHTEAKYRTLFAAAGLRLTHIRLTPRLRTPFPEWCASV